MKYCKKCGGQMEYYTGYDECSNCNGVEQFKYMEDNN